jgi:hypothetical protein
MRTPSKLRRNVLILAGLVVLFTLTGFFLAPVIVKSQLEKRLSAELGRRVTVEKVRVNPYALSLTLEQFAIREPDGTSPFVTWRTLYVNADILGPIWRELTLREVVLDGFDIRVGVKADRSLTFADIIAKLNATRASAPAAPAGSEKKKPHVLHVGRLQVSDARVDFTDASTAKPFATTLGPVTFTLSDFRTVSESGAPYHFEAVTGAGEKFTWTGSLRAEPLHSAGTFTLENVDLAHYTPYYIQHSQLDVASGKLTVRGRYEAHFGPDRRVLTLNDGDVQLRALKLLERATQATVVELPAIDVTGINADALAQRATITAIALTGGSAAVRREKDGTLNLITLLQPAPGAVPTPPSAPAPASATPAPAAPAIKPDVKVGEFAVKEFRVAVTDLAAPRPAQLALSDLAFSLRDLTLAEGAEMPLQFSATWAPQGTLHAGGRIGIAPIKAELDLDVASLELLPLSPYVEQFVNARLTQGAVTTKLKVSATVPAGQPPAATVSGDITVERLGLVDGALNEELAGFTSLSLKGLKAATGAELSVALEELALTGPYARVIVDKDKKLNLASVALPPGAPAAPATPAVTPGTPAPAPTPPPAATPAAPQPKIEIAKVVITGGETKLIDRSIEPNVTLAVNQFGGTISGLSSTNPAKADLDLKASVNGSGPIAITGKIDPLGAKRFFDLKVDFRNVDLVPLSPYSGRFAGYQLARGKLLLDVKLLLEGNKLNATNVITLNQFTFGGAVQSPDATKLPVRLGVALLKDLNGNIVIDVPVEGSTDDPSFGVGRVVLRVVVNLLTKAAVSPFSLLGAAFGGGGEELAFQEFAPGSTELQPSEQKKLETMVKALTNRPGLSLDLQGAYDPAADVFALKRTKLADAVRRAVWQERRQQDPNIPPPEQIIVSPEEYGAMLKKMYDAKFPPGTEFGAPLPKPPVVAAPPPPPPAGLFKRMMNAISGQGRRQAAAAQQEKQRQEAEHAAAVAQAVATGLPIEEMTGRLAEATTVDENDLRALAQARAQRVRDYFANEGKIAPDRLFLAENPSDAAGQAKGPRVFLGLQ